MIGTKICRALMSLAISCFSSFVFAGIYPNITWYLATIEDIAVELSVPEDLAGDDEDVQYTAEQIAEYFEKFDIKEVPTSEHKFRLNISYEKISESRCRFTVKSEFVRPTTFRRRPQVDWTESDFVRGGCDSDGLWNALYAGFNQALKLMRDRNQAQYQSSQAGARNAEALGRTIGCAIGGDCSELGESSISTPPTSAQSGPEECMFDTDCNPGEKCVKARKYGNGVCASIKRDSSPVSCRFDTSCDVGYYCHKLPDSIDGICLER